MHRRTALKRSALLVPAVLLSSRSLLAEQSLTAGYYAATVVKAPDIPLPDGKREPFGWRTVAIAAEPLVLAWPMLPEDVITTAMRVTVGLDVRDEKLIEVYLPESKRILGTFDVRFGCIFQIFEIPLRKEDTADIRREGVALRLTKGAPLRVFTTGSAMPVELQPHLLCPGRVGDPMQEYLARMDSLACVQALSWQEGCVLDGLLDLSALPAHAHLKDAARRHLDQFIINQELVYENHLSVPSDGQLYGIEGALPYAALANLEPRHPLLENAVKSLLHRQDAQGCIQDRQHTSSEGAYTVGYPLAVIANQRNDETLQHIALTQLSVRQSRLFDGKMFWRTSEPKDGEIKKGNRAWARGIAWQMLGYARTLRELKHRTDLAEHVLALQQLADWILPYQRSDGLWSVFVDELPLTPDTSGSAGIAAALAIGASQGWLGTNAKSAAAKTVTGLQSHLTSDGFLGGVAQANKSSEELQRGSYRVIYQMGMGLMAQLIGALES